jgi:hypothetical protein
MTPKTQVFLRSAVTLDIVGIGQDSRGNGRIGLKAFHMVDFAHRRGAFRHLEGCEHEEERRRILSSLMQTIYREPPRFFAFGCSVDVEAFRELPDQTRKRVDNDPYWLIFQAAIEMAATWLLSLCEKEPVMLDERIAFIFDRKGSYQGLSIQLYNRLKDVVYPENLARLCGQFAFDDDEIVVPLQAADILAYEMAKYLQEKAKGVEKPQRWPMQQIMTKPGRFKFFTKGALEDFFRTAEVVA